MSGVFPQSRELKAIIEKHDLYLYDISPSGRGPYSWGELEAMRPSDQYETSHEYLFIPNLSKDKH